MDTEEPKLNGTAKVMTESEEIALRHQLFIREIESIDEYWGPTFR